MLSQTCVAFLGIHILVRCPVRFFPTAPGDPDAIPLTFVGILPGHFLFHTPFSATSMIGFIALAGIIVRNSILLVDFIRHTSSSGRPMREILFNAGVILTDPIFQGLAISLLFGLASSALLTVLVIPAIYRGVRT